MTPQITYIKRLCVAYLKLPDDPVSTAQKEEIINLIKKEAETL